MKAILMLYDGTVFEGETFGAEKEVCGEVVFNTAMTGYQEILTDPSYKGKIVCLTYPLIGNYGVSEEDIESKGLHLSGLIVREYSSYYSNWRGIGSLENLMIQNGIVGLKEIDTRALTRKIRDHGAMTGIISTTNSSHDQLLKKVRDFPQMVGANYVDSVTSEKSWKWENVGDDINEKEPKYNVVVLDYGSKFNILRNLENRGCGVTILPAESTSEQILAVNPDGLLLSNGPGDPAVLHEKINTIRQLIDKLPIFGICLGHQLLGCALNAKTFKMPFGHHGANHPVKNHEGNRVEITSQNHGFALDVRSLPDSLEVTHTSLYDGSIEGIRHKSLPLFSVQYHPESSPGPHDSDYLFDNFIELIRKHKNA